MRNQVKQMNIQHICVYHPSLSAIERIRPYYHYYFFWRGGEALIERFHLGNIFFIKKAENFTLIKVFS